MNRPVLTCWEPTESQYQQALIKWVEWQKNKIPELDMLYAIPNGFWGASIQNVMRLKREGMRKGVPDLCLAVPKGEYAGLYIEMKRSGGKLSEDQKKWIEKLRKWGYAAVCAVGEENARKAILEYLRL